MSVPSEWPVKSNGELRVVVDAQIALAMFLKRRDRPTGSAKRGLLRFLGHSTFRWLWTPDIIVDYRRGAEGIQTDERLIRRTEFDSSGFQLLIAALQVSLPVTVSTDTLRNARRRVSQASRAADRDLDDAIYLACAVDGNAHLLASEDSDLRSLGSKYESIRIVGWRELKEELVRHGLSVD